MANGEHLKVLMVGVEAWNQWRHGHLEIKPDLSGVDLGESDFRGVDFGGVNLTRASLREANLRNANLRDADLMRADLMHTNLRDADLKGADLSGAYLNGADLNGAYLGGADLREANLSAADLSECIFIRANLLGANLSQSNLSSADLRDANLKRANVNHLIVSNTIFANLDLSEVDGLENVTHLGPSEVSISTLYLSGGQIPEVFLRGCGIPDEFIVQIPALVAAMQPIQFYSCFISYSGKDEAFARRLHSRMRESRLRVWFAPEDIKGGDKLYDQIERAIQVYDRLLLVLSESSMQSKWVETEIRRARKVELRERRRKLFPIRLVNYEALQEWTCIDSTTGEDLAEEVRGYFIPDFSNWKNHDDLEQAFARLLSDLKASA